VPLFCSYYILTSSLNYITETHGSTGILVKEARLPMHLIGRAEEG